MAHRLLSRLASAVLERQIQDFVQGRSEHRKNARQNRRMLERVIVSLKGGPAMSAKPYQAHEHLGPLYPSSLEPPD